MSSMKKFLLLTVLFFSFLSLQKVEAQTLGITANIKALNLNGLSADGIDEINYSVLQSFSLNARLFNDRLWALRLGLGYEDVEYTVDDASSEGGAFASYLANRNNYIFLIGLEKHFELPGGFSFYPGILVPITKNGAETYEPLLSSEDVGNDGWRTSLGVVLGANVRFLRILHLGAEMQMTYDSFRQDVLSDILTPSAIDVDQLSWRTEFTIGVYF